MLVAHPVASASAAVVSADLEVRVGLGGSRASMRRQHHVARQLDLTFLRTPAQVREFANKDRLEYLPGNQNYTIGRVAYPYARSAVKIFIERLAQQYREATGDVLVVTSLTRPVTRQPRNASRLSVHPTGIAVDFRIPKSRSARRWLENTLLTLEGTGVLDATRERRPPHYHVAVFPDAYDAYVRKLSKLAAAPAEPSMMVAGLTHAPMPAMPDLLPDPSALALAALEPSLGAPASTTPMVTVAIALVVIGTFGVAFAIRKARV